MTSKTKHQKRNTKNETPKTKYKNGINREHPGTTESKVRFRKNGTKVCSRKNEINNTF